jgi:hypothetical protein
MLRKVRAQVPVIRLQSTVVLDLAGVECYGERRGWKAPRALDLAGQTGSR